MKIKSGVTRLVFVFENYVIKIPNFTYSFKHFVTGVLANMDENETWKWNSGRYCNGFSHLLCPVLWCSFGGWFLIMKRAETFTETNKELWLCDEHILRFNGDDKIANYGLLNGKVVKIDYASVDVFLD